MLLHLTIWELLLLMCMTCTVSSGLYRRGGLQNRFVGHIHVCTLSSCTVTTSYPNVIQSKRLADGPADGPHGWLNSGEKGVDFEGNLASPDVDLAVIHVYPGVSNCDL